MLRDYQKQAAESVTSWLRYKPLDRCIVVIPTGGGKSWVIKALAEHFARLGKRVLIVADRRELLEQTGEKIDAEMVGYYSAGIGERELSKPITIAGIQSLDASVDYGAVAWDIIIIDECDLVSNDPEDDTRYWRLLNAYPNAMGVGLTATPWRTKDGKLTWGNVVYEIGYAPLIAAGYLAPLSNKLPPDVQPDLSGVDVQLGDYVLKHLSKVMESESLVRASVGVVKAYARGSNLIFTVSIAHSLLLHQALLDNGVGVDEVAVVSGDTPPDERDGLVERFKAGALRFLINCELFLRGFDAPRTDAIFCLRPTKSKTLWEQLCGRGVRPFEGKENCLLVDMSGNLAEHGALGSPFVGKGTGGGMSSPYKICPECEEYTAPRNTRECKACGYQWPDTDPSMVSHNLTPNTSSDAIYQGKAEEPYRVTYDVEGVSYQRHRGKKGKPDTLRIDYACGYGKYGSVSEWLSVAPEASEWARKKAEGVFKSRGHELGAPVETYTFDDLLFHAEHMRKPTRITIEHGGEWPRIVAYDFTVRYENPEDALGDDQIPMSWDDVTGASHD